MPSHPRLGVGIVLVCLVAGCAPRQGVPVWGWHDARSSWLPCPDDLGGRDLSCTQAEVPQDWSRPDAERFKILVRRRPADDGGSSRQLWVLDGGPGFAGDAFLDPLFADRVRRAGLDLIVVSHRGTVGESVLHCPVAQSPETDQGLGVSLAEWPACRSQLEQRWGPGLAPFTSRFAAMDVAHLMRAMPADEVLVFGGSYGSLWAHRLLLDTDAPVDAVLLDSIVPIGASLERVHTQADAAAEAVLSLCGEREACAGAFDGDPVRSARASILAFSEGEGCGQQDGRVSREAVQHYVRRQLDGHSAHWRRLVELYARLGRCTSEDVDSIETMLQPASGAESPYAGVRYSVLLNRHVLYRELYRFDLDEDELASFEQRALASDPNTRAVLAEAAAFGPDYRVVDEPIRERTSVPTTLLSGALDPLDAPAWARDFEATLQDGQRVLLPWAGHSTLRYLDLSPDGCGSLVLESFLATGAADTSCVSASPAPSLAPEL